MSGEKDKNGNFKDMNPLKSEAAGNNKKKSIFSSELMTLICVLNGE